MKRKVIARILGGLGNQFFSYAAARRLALRNDAELVLDTETGFLRDSYQRFYQLDAFCVAGRTATSNERLQPLERPRRAALRFLSAALPYQHRPLIKRSHDDFDPRLLSRRVRGTVIIDGIWASEGYFLDISDRIRAELQLRTPPADAANAATSAHIGATNAVGMHVRWFDSPGTQSSHNVSPDYYRRAIALAKERLDNPYFFVFSDNPDAAKANLPLDESTSTFVRHNDAERGAVADFWLLRQCRHFVIANSTFSWWAAWLGEDPGKLVICPSTETVDHPSWTLSGLIPAGWTRI